MEQKWSPYYTWCLCFLKGLATSAFPTAWMGQTLSCHCLAFTSHTDHYLSIIEPWFVSSNIRSQKQILWPLENPGRIYFFLFPCCTVFHEHLTQTCCDRHKFRTWNRQLPTRGLVTLQIMTNYLTPLWSVLLQGTLLDWKTPAGFPSCVGNSVWLLQHPKTQPLVTLTVRWHLLFLHCLHFFCYILDFWAMYVVKFVTSITSIYPILHIVTYQRNNPFCESSILRPINVFCF